MPPNWNWFKWDKKNIKNLAKKGRVKLRTFPTIGTLDKVYYEYIRGIKWISFLDYLPEYNKFTAIKILKESFDFKPYPYKHYESVFTRFYQGYILPVKFGVDKRKHHLSTLVLSGQMDKDKALEELTKIPYPNEESLIDDIEYFLKKMEWDKNKFMEYLSRPEKPHKIYGSELWLWNLLKIIKKKFIKKL